MPTLYPKPKPVSRCSVGNGAADKSGTTPAVAMSSEKARYHHMRVAGTVAIDGSTVKKTNNDTPSPAAPIPSTNP